VDGPLVHASLDGLPRSSAVAALVAAGIAVEQVGPRRRLEDAFLQLIGEEPLAGSSISTEEPLAGSSEERTP
jgi:ABC-2 type transport system ATP-binding protein